MSNLELNLLAIPFSITAFTPPSQLKNSFLYFAPKLWNTLPLDVRSGPIWYQERDHTSRKVWILPYIMIYLIYSPIIPDML